MAQAAGPLRFRPALRDAWRLWHRNLSLFGPLAFAVVAPLLVIGELIWDRLQHSTRLPEVFTFLLAGVVLAAVGEALCAGLAEHALRDEMMGHPRRSFRVLLRLLPLGTLSVLAFIVGVVVTVGTALFVLPGLAAFAWLATASPAASFDRHGVREALVASVRLVRGHFWHVAAVTSVTFVPSAFGDAAAALLHAQHAPFWLIMVAEAVIEAVIISFTAAVVVVVYHTLRAEAAQARVAEDDGTGPG